MQDKKVNLVRTIEAFKTPDGTIFEDARKAEAHADDLLGAELDEFLRLLCGVDTYSMTIHKALLKALDNKDEVKRLVNSLHRILNYDSEGT